MRTCRRVAAGLGLAASVVLFAALPLRAEGGYASASEAFRAGIALHEAGRYNAALPALEYAARSGVLGAQLKLAEMFAAGDGVKQSHSQAFYYYERVADEYADVSPRHPIARSVAGAFVALGEYYRDGITEVNLRPEPERAVGLFRHAASYFGDPKAQFNLAKMYLAGEGVQQNVGLAVNWLASAAKKQYAPAQAVLGDLLWRGGPDIARQPHKGLALLALARQNPAASEEDKPWIAKLYEQAVAEAAPDQRQQATEFATQGGKQRPTAEIAPGTAPPAASPLPAEGKAKPSPATPSKSTTPK